MFEDGHCPIVTTTDINWYQQCTKREGESEEEGATSHFARTDVCYSPSGRSYCPSRASSPGCWYGATILAPIPQQRSCTCTGVQSDQGYLLLALEAVVQGGGGRHQPEKDSFPTFQDGQAHMDTPSRADRILYRRSRCPGQGRCTSS